MSSKLQELTEKLYNEGLSKGKEEGARILDEARVEASSITAKAKKEAEAIIAEASRKAEEIRSKAESDIRMASAQCMQATRNDIENLLSSMISSPKVDAALADTDLVKEIIKTVAANFSNAESKELSLILPASMKEQLEPWISSELGKVVGNGIQASFSKKIQGGFTIGPRDGSYFISLTDETFKALIAEYLRPATRKLLFG